MCTVNIHLLVWKTTHFNIGGEILQPLPFSLSQSRQSVGKLFQKAIGAGANGIFDASRKRLREASKVPFACIRWRGNYLCASPWRSLMRCKRVTVSLMDNFRKKLNNFTSVSSLPVIVTTYIIVFNSIIDRTKV